MRRAQAFPSSYLSKEDVQGGPIRGTIEAVRIETIQGAGDADEKPVMVFVEPALKHFVLNQTNWLTIEEAFGPESDLWAGHVLELYLDPGVKFGNQKVGGVRVRIPGGARSAPMEPLSFDDAVALARIAGMDKDALIAALKARGLAGYSARRDTAAVRSIIAAHHAGGAVAPSAEAENLDDVIPF